MLTLVALHIVRMVVKVNIKQYYISQNLLDNIKKLKYTLFLGTYLYNVVQCYAFEVLKLHLQSNRKIQEI